MRRLGPEAVWIALGALVAGSAALRLAAAERLPTPWVMPDEAVYALLARSLAAGDGLAILGGPTPFYSLVYPALLALPLELGLGAAKALGALLVSATAVPVFLWARRLMPAWWALAAAALTLTLPALGYASMLMTEVAFLPAAALALWAIARAVERPTARAQLLAAGAIVLASATRLQAIVLVPVLVTAVLGEALMARRRPAPRAWLPAGAALAAAALAWAGYALRDGGPWTKLLGGYSAAGTGYDLSAAAGSVVRHSADALLLVAVFPAAAFSLLAVRALLGRERDPAARAFVAVTLAYGAWVVVQVGVFASSFGPILERDLITIAPPLLIAFAL